MALQLPVDKSTAATPAEKEDCEVTRALADAYDTAVKTHSVVDVTHPFSWDERRKLALDIVHLTPPDQPGVLLLAHAFAAKHSDDSTRSAVVTQREFAPPPITQWDASIAHDAPMSDATSTTGSSLLQLECGVDLDSAHPELLQRLRSYVDSCYVPHYVPKENCGICEGLWSCGRVVACGNDACDTRIHEECFGVVLREPRDGPWLCPSCLLGRQLLCAVCMQYGGALKPVAPPPHVVPAVTDEQKWVHALCALAIPELVMRDVPTLEPVEGFDEIENGRFRYLCGICRKRGGASIICEHESCNVGMHPLCAANAGLMVGCDSNALAVFCEKHLPAARVIGAKRLISDEDLVEEIMSETTSADVDDPDADEVVYGDVPDAVSGGDRFPGESQRYAFILASTPYVVARAKLLGDRATLKWGSSGSAGVTKRVDLRAKTFDGAVRRSAPPPAWAMPSDAGGWRVRRPYVFPPPVDSGVQRVGLAPFPAPLALVGAIVDLAVKAQDEWLRARVVEYDAAKRLHIVQLVATGQKLSVTLAASNTLVLHLPREVNVLDGPRVRLVRAVTQGEALWRPKPRTFAAASS